MHEIIHNYVKRCQNVVCLVKIVGLRFSDRLSHFLDALGASNMVSPVLLTTVVPGFFLQNSERMFTMAQRDVCILELGER